MYSVFQGARVSTSTVQCDLLPIFLRVDVVRVYLGMRTRTRARCKSADGDNSEKEREKEEERMERERKRESLDALFQCESRLVGLERTRERRIIG